MLRRFIGLAIIVALMAVILPSAANGQFEFFTEELYWGMYIVGALIVAGIIWLLWEASDDDGPEEAGEMFVSFNSPGEQLGIMPQSLQNLSREPVEFSLNWLITDVREDRLWVSAGIGLDARMDVIGLEFDEKGYGGNVVFGYKSGALDFQMRFLSTTEHDMLATMMMEYEF